MPLPRGLYENCWASPTAARKAAGEASIRDLQTPPLDPMDKSKRVAAIARNPQ